ncbi:serine/threonine-protein kinase [Polyangium aurulentum]|uniref:serine/threonine-protein kinase n=1 Tax=Polyangium aurulentum TaxID=2567896 RepID=UPI0010ADEC51|nr:serine/threonine-protein kinase [Polyangium aurulentum]UQA56002.1 protein kinase [Polyangium aurulentum]
MRAGDRVDGRFEILRRAGSGGMGEVFQGKDLETGALVAVKVMLTPSSGDRARFEREADALAELRHPAIVRHVARGNTANGDPYLVMEWLDGEDLAGILRERTLDPGEALLLARRVAEALAEAHAHGMIHRDIKPGNLFLVGGDCANVKLLDFGVAWRGGATRMTRTGMLLGTPGYTAPEQARGDEELTPAIDVFALGAVLFEALSGEPAFRGDSVIALLAKLVFDDPPRLRDLVPGIPSQVEALVERMLAKDPAARPRDGAALLDAIDAVAPSAPRPTRRPPTLPTPSSLGGSERRVLQIVLIGNVTGAEGEPGVREDLSPPVLELLQDASRQAGGRLERLADGSMAVALWAPGVAEDRVAVAARFALSIRALVGDRPIALTTGRGALGGKLALSDAIDRAAARLGARGGPTSAIAIDDVTAALLDPRFAFRETPAGHELSGERERADTARTLLGKPTPCVGRERELRLLEEAFVACVDEPGAQAFLITAPAGIGKSRLAHEILKLLRKRPEPLEIWTARGDALRAGSPLGLLDGALRSAAGILDADPPEVRRDKLERRVERSVSPLDARRVASFLGEIVGASFPDAADPPLWAARRDAQLMAEQMRMAFEDFVLGSCAEHAVVLVLEDLHWGDAATLRFVDAALRTARDHPLFVLALARPEAHELFPRLWADRGVQEVRLRPLTRRASERLVREALGEAGDAEAVERLVSLADGHAFYLEELIRAAAEGKRELPETVVAMVQSRLEGLESDARRILRAASIFGEVFWKGSVLTLVGREISASRAAEWLGRLVERELLVRRRDSRFPGEEELAFRHALLREGAYAMLTEEDRALGHRLAAEWLASRGEDDPLVLAGHYERSTEPARAADYWLSAAENAHRRGDPGALFAHVERGLASGVTGETRVAMLGLVCEAHTWGNQACEAVPFAEELLRLAPPGSVPWVQGALVQVQDAMIRGDFPALLDALELVRGVDPSPEAASTVAFTLAVGIAMLDLGCAIDRATQLVERLHALVDRLGARDPLLGGWMAVLHGFRDAALADDPWAGLRHSRRACAIFEQTGHGRGLTTARAMRGMNLWFLGRVDEAEPDLSAAVATAPEMGVGTAYPFFCLAELESARGRTAEAMVVAQRLMAHGRARGVLLDEGRGRWVLARVLARAGDFEAAEREASSALELLGGVRLDYPGVLSTVAAIRLARGDVEGALGDAVRAAEASAVQRAVGLYQEASVRLTHAECLWAAGRHDEARAAIAEARGRLLAIAAGISDRAVRASFLEVVPENARTLLLARQWVGDVPAAGE